MMPEDLLFPLEIIIERNKKNFRLQNKLEESKNRLKLKIQSIKLLDMYKTMIFENYSLDIIDKYEKEWLKWELQKKVN